MSVVVFGSLNLDIVLRLPSRAAWGETLLVDSMSSHVGGKGLNQAIAAARFGSLTAMAGATGDDSAGEKLCAALREEKIALDNVEVLAGAPSGRATILVEPGGDNIIAVEPGANRYARAAAAAPLLNKDARVLLAQFETDLDQTAALFARPEAQAMRKIVNLAPAVPGGERFFDLADMLIFNQTEFATYLALDREPETVEDLLVVQRRLTRRDQAAVVTLGAAGAVAVWADRTLFSAGFPAPDIVDTSGAGDCFCGVVAACVDQGLGLEAALRYANAAASLSVRSRGAAPSIPCREAVEALLGYPA
jgi:ribokinase